MTIVVRQESSYRSSNQGRQIRVRGLEELVRRAIEIFYVNMLQDVNSFRIDDLNSSGKFVFLKLRL